MSATTALRTRDAAGPLGARTIAARVAHELRRRILAGEIEAGVQLKQDALASELGVSRIPIREALVQLESEGLVRIAPHRGAVVSELSAAEVEELFDLRALIEPRLLARSAPRLTAEDFAALDAILAEYCEEMRTDDPSRWGALNTRLHGLLYSRADQPRTEAIVATLLQSTDRYTRIDIAFADGRARAEADHAALVALCRAGAVEEACALLARHIDTARGALVALFESPPAGGARPSRP
ncbi:GntR family transcriptional regulator [Salinarimonas ramus]|uniref:Transcriptional regulator n=1 Tax=Salinarimonas ramus TaxID=690164 RepID=A0A917Q7G7_9HYPH|nr:GntR family transcriptional regulator [Salinarimonas ramus]GGK33173.1 transcriptional regulator [Salinarimonas ramus]